jgi:exo-beta-1,3-glucanase (GH17 family)
MTMFVGVFNIDDCAGEVQTIIDAFNGDWSHVAAVSVGNELVNSGTKSVDQVVAAVNQARSLLRGANYQGPVVTVDTFVAIIANPALCQASDFAGANCHAFFDGKVTADNAGNFVKDQAARVAQACGGKRVVITESGWPHQGTANNVAVCTKADQTAAIKSIEASIPAGDLYLLTAFDELWKASKNTANTFNAEQYWGIIGN